MFGQRYLFFGLVTLFAWNSFASPERVTVRGVRSYGAGCPSGSAGATISEGGQAFTLLLDEYLATADRSRPTARRDCDIEIDLDIPRGWSYALVSADYRGFVDVPAGAMAAQRVVYAFERTRDRSPGYENGRGFAFAVSEFRGPRSEEYNVRHQLDLRTAPRSGCSRGETQTLFVNTLLMARVLSARGSGEVVTIGLDSVDGAVQSQTFRMAWFQCDTGRPPLPPRPPRNRFR